MPGWGFRGRRAGVRRGSDGDVLLLLILNFYVGFLVA